MYFAGFCRVCGEGLLGVRVCKNGALPLIVCDECESMWSDPKLTGPAKTPRDVDGPVGDAELWGPDSHWADANELDRLQWRKYVIGRWTSRRAGSS